MGMEVKKGEKNEKDKKKSEKRWLSGFAPQKLLFPGCAVQLFSIRTFSSFAIIARSSLTISETPKIVSAVSAYDKARKKRGKGETRYKQSRLCDLCRPRL